MLPWLHLPLNKHLRYLDIYIYSRKKTVGTKTTYSNQSTVRKKTLRTKIYSTILELYNNLLFFFSVPKHPITVPPLETKFQDWYRSLRLDSSVLSAPWVPSSVQSHPLKGEALGFQPSIWVFPKMVGFPPKSSTLIGFSIINHPFWGTPIFGNTHFEVPYVSLREGSFLQNMVIFQVFGWQFSEKLHGTTKTGAFFRCCT